MHVPEERNMDLLISLREHIGMGMFQGFLIVKLVSFFYGRNTYEYGLVVLTTTEKVDIFKGTCGLWDPVWRITPQMVRNFCFFFGVVSPV